MAERGGVATGRDISEKVADVGASRWWWVAYGVLSILAGIAAMAWPGVTLLALAVLLAVQLFVLGIFRVVAAFAVPDTSTGMRVLAIVVGILSVIVGVICLRSPLQTIVVLTLVLGAFWLVNGLVEIVTGIAGRGDRGRAWTIVGGVIGVLGGIVVLSAPVTSAVTLAWVLGVLLVVHGIVAVVSGFARTGSSPARSADPVTPSVTAAASATEAPRGGTAPTHSA
jgi:uncharacterized membrane protein HdeD (DUF308 family)